MGLREVGRNRVLWALLLAVPALFVALSAVTTPEGYETMTVREAGRTVAATFWFPDTHPGLMTPISVGALAAVVGLFTALGACAADRRLALAGFHPVSLLTSRLVVVAVLAVVVTAASLAVTALFFEPGQWGAYVLANLLIAFTYALVGVLVGWLFGRVGGVLVAFLLPFLDLAIEQSPILNPEISTLAHLLPGYGASRVLYDAALTGGFDETGSLAVALGWLVGMGVLVAWLLYRLARGSSLLQSARSASPPRPPS
jgi:hypothetical protein